MEPGSRQEDERIAMEDDARGDRSGDGRIADPLAEICTRTSTIGYSNSRTRDATKTVFDEGYDCEEVWSHERLSGLYDGRKSAHGGM